jgi:hypothetical protein
MGLKNEQIHDDAERLEHHLTPELIDELDESLGYPQQDPHGSPIPQKVNKAASPLIRLKKKSKAKITKEQMNEVESELWELGIMPDSIFSVSEIDRNHFHLLFVDKKIRIPTKLAQQINVKVLSY